MKKILSLIAIVAVAILTSCSQNDIDESTENIKDDYTNWANRNLDYFKLIYAKAKSDIAQNGENSKWAVIPAFTKDPKSTNIVDYIVAYKIDSGTDLGHHPMVTDSVKIHYAGYLIPTDLYHTETEGKLPFVGDYPTCVGLRFDSSWKNSDVSATAKPYRAMAGDFITGFTTALLHMSPDHPNAYGDYDNYGDRWIVFIPSALGYGTAEKSTIPAGSTLIFDLILTRIWQAKGPVVNAKPHY